MNRPEICPDGSDRSFSRTRWHDKPAVAISPGPGRGGMLEAESFFLIGSHLFSRRIPVPEIYLYDRETGTLMVEDLGDESLQYAASALLSQGDFQGLLRRYRQVLNVLIAMQTTGTEGFDPSWCWQEPLYDSRVAMKKEALYFVNAFLKGCIGLSCPDEALYEEFKKLTRLVDGIASRRVFLHRDFQSRNLMITNGNIRIIDFQSGRLGPPGYDLASLLHDPYVSMPWAVRDELYNYYCARMEDMDDSFRETSFRREFHLLSIMRLLQALGAYGFLVKIKKRPFFEPFMQPALETLERLLENWYDTRCRHIISCIRIAAAELS